MGRHGGQSATKSPCCWCVEIGGIVATLLIRPRSVTRQINCMRSNAARAAGMPPRTVKLSRCPKRLTGEPRLSTVLCTVDQPHLTAAISFPGKFGNPG